jgi:hypothetical protein
MRQLLVSTSGNGMIVKKAENTEWGAALQELCWKQGALSDILKEGKKQGNRKKKQGDVTGRDPKQIKHASSL